MLFEQLKLTTNLRVPSNRYFLELLFVQKYQRGEFQYRRKLLNKHAANWHKINN